MATNRSKYPTRTGKMSLPGLGGGGGGGGLLGGGGGLGGLFGGGGGNDDDDKQPAGPPSASAVQVQNLKKLIKKQNTKLLDALTNADKSEQAQRISVADGGGLRAGLSSSSLNIGALVPYGILIFGAFLAYKLFIKRKGKK